MFNFNDKIIILIMMSLSFFNEDVLFFLKKTWISNYIPSHVMDKILAFVIMIISFYVMYIAISRSLLPLFKQQYPHLFN